MDKQTQKQLFEEIKVYLANGSTRLADREMPYPASAYYDADHLAQEKRLFSRYPLIVGHADELKEPGDFITNDLLGMPVIVVRQKDGTLKAFRNVCSHRGARVCDRPRGNASQFLCPYHAWTYGMDGALKGVPRSAFPGLDKAKAGLPEMPVAEHLGLIWLQGDPGSHIDISDFLGVLDKEITGFGMEDCVLHRSEILEANINWKSVLDGFLEVYHFATLHAGSIAPYFYGSHSPFDGFGLHGRMVGVRKSFDTIAAKAFEEVEFLPNVAVNYQIFPNTIIVWQGDHFEVWTSFPGNTPGTCRVLVQMLVPRALYLEDMTSRWARNWQIMMDTVIGEDWAMSEDVQAALPYILNDQVIFGANEPALQHLHGNLARLLAGMN